MKENIEIFNYKEFDDEKIIYGFTGRKGGSSSSPYESLNLALHVGDDPETVGKNRKTFAEAAGFDEKKLTWCTQVHGDDIYILKNKMDAGFAGEYDGIITSLRNIPVITMYADCIPVLLHDPVKNVIATIHAGWKGTFLEISGKAVKIMKEEYGSKPDDIKALIGPGICREHYSVDPELALEFRKKFPESVSLDSAKLDLREINKQILKQQGLTKIFDMNICTSCDNENFFSFRKENGVTGRFAALIMLK